MGPQADLGARVRALRQQKGLSQLDLAKMIPGVSQQSIDQLENGQVRQPRFLRELARALGVDFDWLYSGESQGTAARADDIDPMHLRDVIIVLEQALEAGGYTLSPDSKAELIGVLYELSIREDARTPDAIRSMADVVVHHEFKRRQAGG